MAYRTAAPVSTYFHDFAYHTIAFPVPSAGGDAPAMGTHRQAFPTPGVPPPPPRHRMPGGGGGGSPRLPGGHRGVSPRLRYAGDAPAAPGVVARRL